MTRRTTEGMVLAILVVAALGAGYLAVNTGRQASTSAQGYGDGTISTSDSRGSSASISSASGGQPIPVTTVETGNFSLPGGIAYALDSSTNRMFILGTSSLTVVDMSSVSVIAKVELPANNTGGSINAGLTLDPNTGTVYASVQGEVVEVNGSTNTLVGVIPLALSTLAFNPATHVLWGTMFRDRGGIGSQNGSLVGVDVRTNSVVENVSIGFEPFDVAVDSRTNMVYSDGCTYSFVCGSEVAVVDGARGTLVATVSLGSGYYPTMTLNPATHVLYVSGEKQLAAINGTTGGVIFKVDLQTCGPFVNMVVDPSSNLVLTATATNYYYLLAYDGATGKLVNMYSFPSTPVPVALNPNSGELYLWTTAGPFISIRMLSAPGNVNSALIGAGRQCPIP
jgi:hypothetical protein